MNDEPVRIKLYGFLSVTKRSYLVQLVLGGVLLIALLLLWSYLDSAVAAWPAGDVPDSVQRARSLASWLPWVIGLIALLYALEAYVVLRRFARKEAAQPAPPPASSPPP